MLKQIFRTTLPNDTLFNLLDQISLKTDNYYLIDINAYKKMIFHNLHTEFLTQLVEYYHLSKQFYITRKITYNSFVNIVRQICKNNSLMFSSQIKYNKSKYNINYLIYYKTI